MKLKIGKPTKPDIVFLSIILGLLVIDMISKVFTDGVVDLTVIPHVISFDSHHNTGIAFSFLGDGGVWLAVMTAILTVCVIVAWWFLGRKKTFASVAFAFFVAGAAGNLYDRIAYGHVRDFIKFDFWSSFPIFNFADICLTAGTIMLVIYFIFFTGKKKEAIVAQGKITTQVAEQEAPTTMQVPATNTDDAHGGDDGSDAT